MTENPTPAPDAQDITHAIATAVATHPADVELDAHGDPLPDREATP